MSTGSRIKELEGANILITGATGFVGKNLAKHLITKGVNVFSLIHQKSDLDFSAEKIQYDGSYNTLISQLNGFKIDGIVHLATKFLSKHNGGDISTLIDANVKLGVHLLEITKELDIDCFINTSTYAQFYNHDAFNPQNLYAASKNAFEMFLKYYVETEQCKYVTLELTDTYGPNDSRPKFINLVLDAVKKDEVFKMSLGEQEICYIYIDDVIKGYEQALTLIFKDKIKSGDKYSIYSNETYKLKDLVNLIFDSFNVNREVDTGFYSYRDREIMTFQPSYPKLPEWESTTSIIDGSKKILNK